jgi:hypothetical protein
MVGLCLRVRRKERVMETDQRLWEGQEMGQAQRQYLMGSQRDRVKGG